MQQTVDNWQKIEEAVAISSEMSPKEFRAWLADFCGADAALKKEIESLVAFQEKAESFLEKSAGEYAAKILPTDELQFAGKRFGNYRIVREIGRGGMGAVFLAERTDGEFEQQVALKIVRQTILSRESEERFRRERQILARLNHPNIARLLDGGVSEMGEPFLAMEYVEGVSLNEFSSEQNLDLEERLRLFLKICAAVSYLHRNLIVHRDIKPSNVIVTRDGEPKLLDFGLAKILKESLSDREETVTTFRAFTPAYASPEQLRGQNVTTASDVYSLGVCLYELLTGERPYHFKTDSFEDVYHAVCETEPMRPSSVVSRQSHQTVEQKAKQLTTDDGRLTNLKSKIQNPKLLSGDLDNIILKSLRKEPERRYPTVEQFAGDVERYLKGLPVSARPSTFAYRAEKFIERNRLPVLAAALIVLSLVGGLAVSLWQATIARQERDRATRRFADVRQLSNALLTEIAPKIERLQGATEARETLVAQSLKYLDSLAQESGDDLSLQSELAAAYEKVGEIQGNPSNPSRAALNEALTSYEKAMRIRLALLEKNSKDFEQRRLLANNYKAQGDVRWEAKEINESEKMAQAALALYFELLEEQPDSQSIRLARGQTFLDIGQNLTENQKFADSIPYFQKAIIIAEEMKRQFGDQIPVLALLANGNRQIGTALSWNSQQKEAEDAMQRAVEIYESLAAANSADVNLRTGLAQTYLLAASIYEEINDQRANEFDFKALRVAEEISQKDPADLRAKDLLAKIYSHLGVTFKNIGKTSESVAYLEKAVAILREISLNETKNARFKQNLATALIRFGDANSEANNFQNARPALEEALKIMSEIVAGAGLEDNNSQRIFASTNQSLAVVSEGLAERASGAEKETLLARAKQLRVKAFEVLRQLEARGALSEYDRKLFEQLRQTVQKYEQ